MNSYMYLLVCALLVLLLPATSVLALSSTRPKKYYGGAGVGRLVIEDKTEQWKCHYDMVLVERIQGRPPTESGLFIPQEDLPKLHLCKGRLQIKVHLLSNE